LPVLAAASLQIVAVKIVTTRVTNPIRSLLAIMNVMSVSKRKSGVHLLA
jgi:hypothetical protein